MSGEIKPEISVVVPVYNVECYLDACVQSILWQTLRNFELILVDDGSTDGSGTMCDRYLAEDFRIRVIHQENRGLAEARNAGTREAVGRWLTWIDSDDTVDPEYLEVLLGLAEAENADLTSGEFLFCPDAETIPYPEGPFETGTCSGKEAFRRMLLGTLHGTSACGLLLRSELARQFPFPAGRYHEDDMTTYRFFLKANRIAFTKRPLYSYRQRAESIMHHRFGRMDRDELDAADELLAKCGDFGPGHREAGICKSAHSYWEVARRHGNLKQEDQEVFQRIHDFFRVHCLEILKNPHIPIKMKARILLYQAGAQPS